MEIPIVNKKNKLTIMVVPIPNPITGSFPSRIMVANKVPNAISELPIILAFKGEKKELNIPDTERITEKAGRIYF